ncbi:two-component sensor histidine kinase [Williamsia phyllosphaerae]|uniref:histidine kinase n=1 Tax=Williamsia phyllosphaerae TaxID=885042 RepID=A0ABQ1UV37_9NOCA|nr:two-component sensor histidine kinase [Williamsia phyllosphaerae]
MRGSTFVGVRIWRRTRDTIGTQVRALPLAADPTVLAFIGRRVNIAFTVVALIMFSIAWPTLPLTHSVIGILLPVVAALAAFPVMLAWANPMLGWGISLISALLIGALFDRVHEWMWTVQVVHIIEMLVLAAMVTLRGPIRWIPLYWLCTCAVFVVAAPSDTALGWVVGLTMLFVTCWLLRVLLRSRRELAHETELKDVAASRTAVLAERARIARDLHDVVAHRMSVVVVAAQTARFRVDGVTPAADAEFQSIAVMAREALDEVRQMLGVLRVDGEVSTQAPNPGVAEIADIVAATRGAGITVDLRWIGAAPETVNEVVGLTAYRIAQECLANATRHAPGARIDVEIAIDESSVRVTVVNLLADVDEKESSGGHGIPGMSERAEAVGGVLVAGPDGVGAFRVSAMLPMRLPVADAAMG